MTTDRDDLEPVAPEQGQRLFLDHRATNCTESTVRNHKYRTKHLIEWCEKEGIDNLNELSGRDMQQHRIWRKETSDITNLTLRMHMSTLRVFLRWAGMIEAVPENLYTKVILWETGMRIGGANSIDPDDVSFERGRIRLVHRPDQGTTLKNGQGCERLVAMTSDLSDLLKDHIDN